jgi:hypothetical protein
VYVRRKIPHDVVGPRVDLVGGTTSFGGVVVHRVGLLVNPTHDIITRIFSKCSLSKTFLEFAQFMGYGGHALQTIRSETHDAL